MEHKEVVGRLLGAIFLRETSTPMSILNLINWIMQCAPVDIDVIGGLAEMRPFDLFRILWNLTPTLSVKSSRKDGTLEVALWKLHDKDVFMDANNLDLVQRRCIYALLALHDASPTTRIFLSDTPLRAETARGMETVHLWYECMAVSTSAHVSTAIRKDLMLIHALHALVILPTIVYYSGGLSWDNRAHVCALFHAPYAITCADFSYFVATRCSVLPRCGYGELRGILHWKRALDESVANAQSVSEKTTLAWVDALLSFGAVYMNAREMLVEYIDEKSARVSCAHTHTLRALGTHARFHSVCNGIQYPSTHQCANLENGKPDIANATASRVHIYVYQSREECVVQVTYSCYDPNQ